MRRFVRYVLFGLVLLMVMMASALTAMRFAIHGREVMVPRLTNLKVPEAEASANNMGLILLVENKYYSSSVPAGKIISQYPQEGSQVRRGWRVRVTESMGPQRSDIPNLVGQSIRAAEINVSRRGLELGSVATVKVDSAPAGQVLAQSPPAHASGAVSPKVSLLAAASDSEMVYVMPNFVGKHLADVVPRIEDAGMKLGNISEVGLQATPVKGKSFVESTIIVKQSPLPGQKISAGGTVSFEISR